jgi:hypothetical protein
MDKCIQECYDTATLKLQRPFFDNSPNPDHPALVGIKNSGRPESPKVRARQWARIDGSCCAHRTQRAVHAQGNSR